MAGEWNDAIRKLHGPAPKEKEMSRREEVEAIIRADQTHYTAEQLCFTLADEVDALRADRDNAVKNGMDRLPDAPWKDKTATEAVWLLSLALTGAMAAAEDLRAEADPDALTICYMQGQAQGDAEARAAHEVVTKLLALLKPGECKDWLGGYWLQKHTLYTSACQIAGRTE